MDKDKEKPTTNELPDGWQKGLEEGMSPPKPEKPERKLKRVKAKARRPV